MSFYREVYEAFDDKPLEEVNGYRFIINPLTEQIPATSASCLNAAVEMLAMHIPKSTTKLITEEDKGAILVAGVSLKLGLPFGMVRWVPNGLANQLAEKFSMEYVTEGTLYLCGIEVGDRVTIIEDMISTGGTLISMIKAIERASGIIEKIVSLAEKVNYKGVERIKRETGHPVLVLIQIDVSGERSKVLNEY